MGSNKGYNQDKYDNVASGLYNSMIKRSKRRGHNLLFSNREFQLWAKEQEDFISNCDIWYASKQEPYSPLKPSCNRLEDDKPYSFDNMEMITWGEHLKYTSESRLSGTGKNHGHIPVMVMKDGKDVYEAESIADAIRWIRPEANVNSVGLKVTRICKGIGPNKSLYGHTFRFL